MSLAWSDLSATIHRADPVQTVGTVTNLVGMIIEVGGLGAPVGAVCRIEIGRHQRPVQCEVVGFRDNSLLLMPYQTATGIAPGCRVTVQATQLTVPVGPQLLGRVLDGLGRPLDGGPPLAKLTRKPLGGSPPPALQRRRTDQVMSTGIRSIDSMITTARQVRLAGHAGPAGERGGERPGAHWRTWA